MCCFFIFIFFFFFFSSRRRHTRFDCDWSSDVCSSDLLPASSALAQCTWRRICLRLSCRRGAACPEPRAPGALRGDSCCWSARLRRSEEHTSELQSQSNLVCRLLLEKKKHGASVRNI